MTDEPLSPTAADALLVLSTVPDEEKGRMIARTLVEERLAACVTVGGAAESFYRWEGRIAAEREFVLIIKTRTGIYPRLEARLKALHPYSVPEIIALPVAAGHPAYLAWLERETGGGGKS